MTNCSRAGGRAGSNYPFLTSKERDIETGLDYFLARYYSSTQERVTPDNFPDPTGYECFVNHIHVEDQVDDSLSEQDLLKQGIAFAFATESQLRFAFPKKSFNVIVAATSGGCGVRFHSVRRGEEWLASNLEGYADEAILVLET